MGFNTNIQVLGTEILVHKVSSNDDYISLTDIAKYRNPTQTGLVISHWLSTKYAVEFMGIWEKIHNSNFNVTEFSNIKDNAGTNGFVMSVSQWFERVGAIGIRSKAGRYGGGTFAHKDIAFEFASWISPEFKMYLIKEFQRLKEQELQTLDRNVKRFLTKINYKIHTDAIRDNLIPPTLTKQQTNIVYADEADLLNMALFGQTAKQWKDAHSNRKSDGPVKGNMRDEATIEQLIILANIESMNAEYIKLKLPQSKRLELLNQTAISQMTSLISSSIKQSLPQ